MINIRQKGAEGERQVVRALNEVLQRVLEAHQWPEHIREACKKSIQRNQNQSAVGGNDLVNVFGLGIEVKRQEELSINTWWKQCTEAAMRNHEFPVLVYRKNKQAWSVVMYASLPLPFVEPGLIVWPTSRTARVTVEWADFLIWVELWFTNKLVNGEVPRV